MDLHWLGMGAVRGIWLSGLVVMLGVSGFKFFVLDPVYREIGQGGGSSEIRKRGESFTRRWTGAGFVIFFLTGFAGLIHEMRMIRPLSEMIPITPLFLTKTHWGRIWTLRLALSLVSGFFWFLHDRRKRPLFGWFLVSLFPLAATFSLIGHLAEGGDLTLAVLADAIHLLAVSLWIGGLIPLVFFLPSAFSSRAMAGEALVAVVEKFSRMAVLSVILIIATGLTGLWFVQGGKFSWSWMPGRLYGQVLFFKVAFAGAVLCLGGAARFWILPVFRRHRENLPPPAAKWFFRLVSFELFLALIVLAGAFLLTQAPPPR